MEFLRKISTLPISEQERIKEILKKVCDEHNIEFRWATTNFRADRVQRRVWIPELMHYYQIATCLQEIGHLVAPQNPNSEMDREYEACAWAVEKASDMGIPFDKSCWAQMFRSLNAYAQKHLPPQDHPAWVLLEKARTLGQIGEPAETPPKKAEGNKKTKAGKKKAGKKKAGKKKAGKKKAGKKKAGKKKAGT
jgi:hypothetical protein